MSLSRTWYTRGNIAASDTSTAALLTKSFVWALKECLIGGAGAGGTLKDTAGGTSAPPNSSKWTVEGSSDSATASVSDLSDRWTSTFDGTKIVQNSAGNAHSWIVLKSPVTLTRTMYILIATDSATTQNCTIVLSYNAFTGGSTTANPTSTGSWNMLSNQQVCENTTTAHRFHYTVDANGQFFFHSSKNSGGTFHCTLMGIEAVMFDTTNDTYPFVTCYQYNASGVIQYNTTWATAAAMRTYNNGATQTGCIATLKWPDGSDIIGNLAINQTRTVWDTLPMVVGSKTSGAQGMRGTLPDIEFAGNVATGGSNPSTTAQERMTVGCMFVPHAVVPNL